MAAGQILLQVLAKYQQELLAEWLQSQRETGLTGSGLMKDSELREQSREFLKLVQEGARGGGVASPDGAAWTPAKDFLASISRSQALQGFTPRETATFVFSLKKPRGSWGQTASSVESARK
jgi:rsbT co-antagonist protein RsbR